MLYEGAEVTDCHQDGEERASDASPETKRHELQGRTYREVVDHQCVCQEAAGRSKDSKRLSCMICFDEHLGVKPTASYQPLVVEGTGRPSAKRCPAKVKIKPLIAVDMIISRFQAHQAGRSSRPGTGSQTSNRSWLLVPSKSKAHAQQL